MPILTFNYSDILHSTIIDVNFQHLYKKGKLTTLSQ